MKVTDKHVCFWNEWPSNWHPAEFDIEVNDTMCHFHNTEQYFMYMKAIVFGDEDIAKQILEDGDPKKVKALGRKVQNYDERVWNEKTLSDYAQSQCCQVQSERKSEAIASLSRI